MCDNVQLDIDQQQAIDDSGKDTRFDMFIDDADLLRLDLERLFR